MRSWIRPALPGSILLALVAASGTGDGTAPRYSPEPQASLQSAWEDASRTTPPRPERNRHPLHGHRRAPHRHRHGRRTPEAAFFYVAYTADGQDPAHAR